MSVTTGCGYALLRGAAVGVGAVLAGLPTASLLSSRRRGERAAAWALLVMILLTPVILVGYAYSGMSLRLVRHPALNELLYDLLVWMKLVPAAALVLHFAPRSLSREALHCHRLLRKGGPLSISSLSFWMRGPGVACAAAFAVVFLLTFSEFEMASLLARPSWTVWLFDAQVGGLALSESLGATLLPVLLEGALLAAVLVLLFRGGRGAAPAGGPNAAARASRRTRLVAWGSVALAAVFVSVVPLAIVILGALEGAGEAFRSFAIGSGIGASVFFALAAAGAAYLAGGALVGGLSASGRRRQTARLVAAVAVSLPGLLGALCLSLVVLAMFQLPLVRFGRDGVAPLIVALTVLLLPFALLLRALLDRLREREALHAASLLAASRARPTRRSGAALLWEMSGRRRFWAALLLFAWAYFDMTCSSLLAPAGMPSVWVTLYNHMHYGQMAVLSARVCAAFFVPVALVLLAAAGLRIVGRSYA